jgi:endonuclease G, mitochondrial
MDWRFRKGDHKLDYLRAFSFAAIGWLLGLILAENVAAQDLHIAHCLHGCPTGTPESNDLVVREVYALSNNSKTKFADWVAYRVTKETMGTSQDLNRGWRPDPSLDSEETLEPNDYTGAFRELDTDRGHQAPLASFAGTVFWRTTNYLSNITPQKSDLNQGPWVNLESAVRDAAYARGPTYVMTGPLFGTEATPDEEMTLPSADESHDIPSAYWKVVATESGSTAAFLFDQETPRDVDYCALEFSRTIEEIQDITGYSLFPDADTTWLSKDFRPSLGC